MTLTIYIILTLFNSLGQTPGDPKRIINDNFEKESIELILKTNVLTIPQTGKGKAFVRLHINNKGVVIKYKIVRCNVKGLDNISFFYEDLSYKKPQYPFFLSKRLKYFDKFLKSQVSIHLTSNKKEFKEKVYTIPVKIN